MRSIVLSAVLLLASSTAQGQCPDDNTLQGSALNIPCPGQYSPTPCVRGGRYLLLNVVSGRTYTVATCGTNLFDTFITLRNNSGGAVMAFNDDACGTQSSVTWTATYTGQLRVLIDQSSTCNATSPCTPVYISCSTTAPTNDLICNATLLPVNSNCVNLSPSPTNVAATASAPPPVNPACGGFTGGDIWFRLVVPAGGNVTITTRSITSSAFLDAGMAAYASSNNLCTGILTELACNDDIDFPYNEMSELVLTGLPVGNTIFIRVWEGGNDLFGRFQICARITPPLPDVPCTAIPVTVTAECEMQNYTNVAATTTNPPAAPSCGNFTSAMDVWYSFTAPANGQVVIQSDDGTLTDGCIAIYSSSNGLCSGTLTQVACNDDSYTFMPYLFQTGLTPGTTYWLRFWGYAGASGTYQMCMFSPPGTRVEDCLGSTTVCDDQHVENANQYTGNVSDLSVANRGCLASSERQGTWYIFSIATNGQLGFTISPLAADDYDWAIWGPFAAGSTTNTSCVPGSAPIRCSYASGSNTLSATGSYNTGMGNATWDFPTTYSNPTTCGACTEGAGGNGWVRGINVTTGQVYLLYVSNFSVTGSAFTMSWNFAGGSSLSCSVLPVEWLGFSAKNDHGVVDLSWSTATERNSDYFALERSADGTTFEVIAVVEAAGESQHRVDYAYQDTEPLKAANYYRLKQVDQDGAYELSSVIVVLVGDDNAPPTLFPNPAHEQVNVAFTMPTQGTVYLQVVDPSGRVVRDRDLDVDRGQQTMSIGTAGLPAGAYHLRLVSTAMLAPKSLLFIKE